MFCSVLYSELCLAGISKKSPPPPLPSSPSYPPPPEIYRLGPMDLKICSLEKKPVTVTRQLTKSVDLGKLSL